VNGLFTRTGKPETRTTPVSSIPRTVVCFDHCRAFFKGGHVARCWPPHPLAGVSKEEVAHPAGLPSTDLPFLSGDGPILCCFVSETRRRGQITGMACDIPVRGHAARQNLGCHRLALCGKNAPLMRLVISIICL